MGRIVLVVYRPLEGKAEQLEDLVSKHVSVLKKQNLVSDRKPVIMRSSEGCILELFEWRSAEAIQKAHANKSVNELWEKFAEVCTYEKPTKLIEFNYLFSEFESID